MKPDNELIYYALSMWANHIETNDITMSAEDAHNCGYEKQIKALNPSQMAMVIRLRELAAKELAR